MDEKTAKELALFRYSLIAPVVSGTLTEESKSAYYRRVAGSCHTLPDGKKVRFKACTIKDWYLKYCCGGLDALIPKARIDSGQTRVLPKQARDQIYVYKEKFPLITGKKIHEKLIEDGYLRPGEVSLNTIYRFLNANNLARDGMPGKECVPFEYEHANDLWQADTTDGRVITVDGKPRMTYLITILDDHSRLLLHGEFFFEDNAANMQKVFRKAIQKYGIPRMTLFDNGGTYKNHQLGWICGQLGIQQTFSRPYYPQGKGKEERSHRTEHDRWQNCTDWSEFHSLEDINRSYWAYLDKEYNNHVVRTTGMTPRERYMNDFSRLRFMDSESLDEAFLHRVERKVDQNACISLGNVRYEVPQQYISQKISIRYDPEDLSVVYVYDERERRRLHETRPVKLADNAKRKRRANISYGEMDGGSTNV